MPPGVRDPRPPLAVLALPFRAGTALPRLLRYMRSSQDLLEELGGTEIWRLTGLAVEPAEQGCGIGSALLRAGIERADEDGLAVGLVTDNPRNLPFYGRHGFEVAAERRLRFGPHTAWGMRRPA